jgi:hypothetical protein
VTDKEMAPAVRQHPEARTTKGCNFMANTSVLEAERLRTILREATERYNHELLDDEERQLLLDRIKRLRRKLRLVT